MFLSTVLSLISLVLFSLRRCQLLGLDLLPDADPLHLLLYGGHREGRLRQVGGLHLPPPYVAPGGRGRGAESGGGGGEDTSSGWRQWFQGELYNYSFPCLVCYPQVSFDMLIIIYVVMQSN